MTQILGVTIYLLSPENKAECEALTWSQSAPLPQQCWCRSCGPRHLTHSQHRPGWGCFLSTEANSGPNNYSNEPHWSHDTALVWREIFPSIFFFPFPCEAPLLFSWRLLWWDWMDLLAKWHLFFFLSWSCLKFLQKKKKAFKSRTKAKFIILMSHSWGDISSLKACGVPPVTTDFPGNSIENSVDMH